MKNILLATAACLGLLLVTHCSQSTGPLAAGPGDDFPNSRTALGKTMAACLASSAEWNRISAMPDTLADSIALKITNADSQLATPLSTSPGQAKATAQSRCQITGDTLLWNLADSALGYVTAYRFSEDLFAWTSDTSKVLYNPATFDTLLGNDLRLSVRGQVLYKSNYSLYYMLLDTDTNGFFDTASLTSVSPQFGYTSFFSVQGTSGNDNNFTNPAAIKVAGLQVYTLTGMDTLNYSALQDADRDGMIYNPAHDTNEITLSSYWRSANVFFPPPLIANRLEARALIVSSDKKQLLIKKLRQVSEFSDNHSETVALTGVRPDSTFSGGETAYLSYVKVQRSNSGADTLAARFTLALDNDIYHFSGHRLLSYSVSITTPADTLIRRVVCTFVLDAPAAIAAPLNQLAGHISASISYVNGSQGTLTGALAGGLITATYRASDGTTYSVAWNTQGAVVTN